jgi:hypothetical protein
LKGFAWVGTYTEFGVEEGVDAHYLVTRLLLGFASQQLRTHLSANNPPDTWTLHNCPVEGTPMYNHLHYALLEGILPLPQIAIILIPEILLVSLFGLKD